MDISVRAHAQGARRFTYARMCPCTRVEVCVHNTTGLRDCANTCAFF